MVWGLDKRFCWGNEGKNLNCDRDVLVRMGGLRIQAWNEERGVGRLECAIQHSNVSAMKLSFKYVLPGTRPVTILDPLMEGLFSYRKETDAMADRPVFYPHRRNRDGSFDSICLKCLVRIAHAETEVELLEFDSRHACKFWTLSQRILDRRTEKMQSS